MRKKIVAGNWKMNLLYSESQKIMNEIKSGINEDITRSVEVIIFPPNIYLDTAGKIYDNSGIAFGGQNAYYKENGAFTGEISPPMLKSIGCEYVLLGHSERRQYFGETDEIINLKVLSALRSDLKIVICIGENLTEREKGLEKNIVTGQLSACLKDVCAADMQNVTIAYEPVWAIGTGKTATPQQADKMHKEIRITIEKLYSQSISDNIRIIYGGSVNEKNSLELFKMPDIDGGLIGGASLLSNTFIKIIKSVI